MHPMHQAAPRARKMTVEHHVSRVIARLFINSAATRAYRKDGLGIYPIIEPSPDTREIFGRCGSASLMRLDDLE